MESSRRQVDDDAVDGPHIAAVDERPFDAMRALLDGGFGQSDEDRLGHGRRRDIDLHLDRPGVDAEQGIRQQFGQHATAPDGRDGNQADQFTRSSVIDLCSVNARLTLTGRT